VASYKRVATIDQVRAQIRYALGQLSARNAHHDFEHLCRQFARQRICTNVLPATGPVSAGGDQGRDFETFKTYMSASPIAQSSFVGDATGKILAFGTTLQKDAIRSKIKADVETIARSGTAVETVYYFWSEDLVVAQRHELQAWALDAYNIHLEILDGQALSEQLSDLDTFWIAEQYLKVPSEIYPDRSLREPNVKPYLQALLQECLDLPLLPNRVSNLRLSEIIPPFITVPTDSNSKEHRRCALADALDQERVFFLVGEAGQGKSTALQYLAWRCARHWRWLVGSGPRTCLPHPARPRTGGHGWTALAAAEGVSAILLVE